MLGSGWAVVDAVAAVWLSGLVVFHRQWLRWTACMIVVGLSIFWIKYYLRPPRESGPHRPTCANNLRNIALALNNYESTYRRFPPAYIADESGKPMHSWRVLILPFLDHKHLYDQYNFDEPWDGPNNSRLHDAFMHAFRCPKDQPAENVTDTSYVVVVGPNTIFRGAESLGLDYIVRTDDASRTLMVVEVANSGIHWMEPRELHVTQMATTINPPAGQGISSNHPGGVYVSFSDGRIRFLDGEAVSQKQLQSMLTVGDGEEVDID